MDPSTSYVASSYFADFGLVLFALFLVLLNGFFVAAEFAIVKLRATKVDALAEKNGWRGHILRTVHNQLDAYLSACQLGITLASLGLGWVGEPAFAHLLEPLLSAIGIESPKLVHGIAFFTAFFIISYLHIVVGELAPKSWAIRKPELLSLWTAAPLYLFYWAMYPAIFLLNASANAILRVAGQGEPGPHHEHHYSRDELKLILHSSRASDPSDQDMRVLASAVELGELEVVDWANSREDLVSLPLNAALDEVFSVFRRHKYSRYPILDDNSGEFVGVLHIKDLLLHLSLLEMLPSALKLAELMHPVERVGRHMPLSSLLEQFRQGGSHFALVEEADGKVIGYLTMEDVLEALGRRYSGRTPQGRARHPRVPAGQAAGARRHAAGQGRTPAWRRPRSRRSRNPGRTDLRNPQAHARGRGSAGSRRPAHHRQEDERPEDRTGQGAQARLSDTVRSVMRLAATGAVGWVSLRRNPS